MPTTKQRINLVRDRVLESQIESLSQYARAHNIKRDSELVRAMIDAGYEELRRQELREAVELNLPLMGDDDDVGEAALKVMVEEGLIE